ncbi:hypothetical protein LguiA_019709 [Lonicera macranthoides]
MFTKLQLRVFIFFIFSIASSLGESSPGCETNSSDSFGYHCYESGPNNQCNTFALLRTNSYFSSLFNLSFFLGLNRFSLAEANGFNANKEYLPFDQPLLIPIDCQCKNGVFSAELTKTTAKGESFNGIVESLEGLTTCKDIKEKNPSVSSWGNIQDKVQLLIPLKCACPFEISTEVKLLLSYPISEGDTVSNLAIKFNTTPEGIVFANNRSASGFKADSLVPSSTILIPLRGKPLIGSLEKPSEPGLGYPAVVKKHKRKSKKMWKIGLYIALSGVAFGISIAIVVAFILMQWKKRKMEYITNTAKDVELQQLSLSVRTTSEKKVSFEDSQCPFEAQIIEPTPCKVVVEAFTLEELRKATEEFSSSNLIEDSVFHGRLNGKNLAIKRMKTETVSKVEFGLFHDSVHHHPNIIRLLGVSVAEEGAPDSHLVFEYAKNGSLKDWLHGGLAMKSQFIASCYCFLTWNQRLRICLDVATALQYMHHIMNPCYVHRNIKSRNIFLDEEFNAKVGNFGMAKCTEDDISQGQGQDQDQDRDRNQPCSSQSRHWAKGYLAPEYLHHGVIAPSIDIFSYGVILLEVLSGQLPISRNSEKGKGSVWLSEKIKFVIQSDNAKELREWMDNALGENYSFDAAITIANLARACVEYDPSLRPNAGEIVEKLSRLVEELPEVEQFTICESSCKPLVRAAANN